MLRLPARSKRSPRTSSNADEVLTVRDAYVLFQAPPPNPSDSMLCLLASLSFFCAGVCRTRLRDIKSGGRRNCYWSACRKLWQVVPTGWCRILSINRLPQTCFFRFARSLCSCVVMSEIEKKPITECADGIDKREDSCMESIDKMRKARVTTAQCTFHARLTRASRGHHAGITRAHADIKVKPN